MSKYIRLISCIHILFINICVNKNVLHHKSLSSDETNDFGDISFIPANTVNDTNLLTRTIKQESLAVINFTNM